LSSCPRCMANNFSWCTHSPDNLDWFVAETEDQMVARALKWTKASGTGFVVH
jgi:hypothetical protein